VAKLAVKIDHVATLRQTRQASVPDPVAAAVLAELGGAHGIVIHLREDRRHIQERDLNVLQHTVKSRLNLQMAPTKEMLKIALSVKPDMVTFVPERREEITTEGALEVHLNKEKLKKPIRLLRDADIAVSVFINPDLDQIRAAQWLEADFIEVHTGPFCAARTLRQRQEEYDKIYNTVKVAHKVGLGVSAGHGLDYHNIGWLVDLVEIESFNIGFAIIARAVLVGFERAVRDMVELIGGGGAWPRAER